MRQAEKEPPPVRQRVGRQQGTDDRAEDRRGLKKKNGRLAEESSRLPYSATEERPLGKRVEGGRRPCPLVRRQLRARIGGGNETDAAYRLLSSSS